MIRCLFGFHDWGKQKNIRETESDALTMFLFPLLIFLGPPRECDRECLRCGKTKTFPYDPARG